MPGAVEEIAPLGSPVALILCQCHAGLRICMIRKEASAGNAVEPVLIEIDRAQQVEEMHQFRRAA